MSDDELSRKIERWDFELARSVISMEKLLSLAKHKQEFLFEQAIPRRAVTFISGPPGSKKSWFAYEMVMRVARGEPWLGFERDPDMAGMMGTVLVLNYDNPTPECGRRYLRLGANGFDRVQFHTLSDSGAMLMLPESKDVIRHWIGCEIPDLVLVDSFRQSHACNENDSQDMAKIMGCMKAFTSMGAAVVILHHMNAGGERMRGSVEIEASADCVIHVTKSRRAGMAQWVKHRGWELDAEKGEDRIGFAVVDPTETKTVVHRVELPKPKARVRGNEQ